MSNELNSAIQEVVDGVKFCRWMERAYVVASNAGISTEDEFLAIAEQLQTIHRLIDGDVSRQRSLKTTAEQFLNYFACSSHKVPTVSVAEIVGDLYAKEGGLSAVHFYCFSFAWAEQSHQPEECLIRLLTKLDLLEKTYYFGLVHRQYVTNEFNDGWFDDQLHSLRTSPDKFSKMIDHFVHAASFVFSDTTKDAIVDMAYCLISRISQETWRIPGKLKAELTNKLLSLRTPVQSYGPVNLDTHRLARRRRTLQELRQSIVDVRQFACDEEMAIQLWFRGMKDIVTDMIDEVVCILGEPRVGIDFAVIAMGSFGRGESSAFSDLEMAIVYKRSGLQLDVVQEYLRVFSTLLWLRVVMLMEDNSKISHMRGGIKLDSSFSFSPEGARPLMMEVSEMVSEFEKGELILSNQLARTRFLWGQEAIALALQTQIQIVAPTMKSKMVEETLNELLQQYQVIYREHQPEGFNVKEEIRLVTLFIQVVGLQFGVYDASTISCLHTLVQEKKMHPGLAQALKTALVWLLSLRYDMHIFYGSECDDFILKHQHQSNETPPPPPTAPATATATTPYYVLTPAQRRKWFLFSPMITSIVVQMIEGILSTKDFVTTFRTLDPKMLHHLATYFVLQHEDELLRFREKEGLSSYSIIDNAYWKDPIILRANYYFETAVLCSIDGTQSAFEDLVGKFFNQIGPLCSIREEYQEPYLTAQPEVYGRRRVIPLSSEVHLKVFPELPGQECLASEIAHRITGYTTSFSCLRKYANRKPLLISKTVIGINLQTLLTQQPKALEELVDHESFSWQFIRTLLLNPEDDKPDNFLVMAYFDEWEQQERMKLVCVDNDHTLSEPVVKGLVWNELLVKSIILCSKAMDQVIHPRVITFFTSSNLEELVISICDALIHVDDKHCRYFTRAEWSQESHDDLQQKMECKIPMFVSEEAAVRLMVKLKTLKTLMENDREITHSAIMTHASLEPIVGKIYEKARQLTTIASTTTEARFTKVTSGLYKIVGHTRMTVSNSEKMLRSSLGKAPTKEQIEQRVLYTPRQMRTKFYSVLPQKLTSQVAMVRRALLAMDPQAKQLYYALTDDILREEVISGRSLTSSGENEPGILFETLHVTQQLFIIQLLKKPIPTGRFFTQGKLHSFSRLMLRHCSALTDRDLLKILAQSPFLQVLDVRNCAQLTDTTLTNIPQVCPRLRVFLKDTRPTMSNFLSLILSAARLMRDSHDDDHDDNNNNHQTDVDINTSIELMENALSNVTEDDAFVKRIGYLAFAKMNTDPEYLKAQPPERVARLFTCAVRLSIEKSDATKALLVRTTLLFLSMGISLDSTLPLTPDIIMEYARLLVLHLGDEPLRQALLPVEVLLLLVVDTQLVGLIATHVGQEAALLDDLMHIFEVLKPLHRSVDGTTDGLIHVWLRMLTDNTSAVRLPQSMIDFVLEIWYQHAKTRPIWRTDDSTLILLLPKLLYAYQVSSSILLFLLESLGELYVQAELDIDFSDGDGGDEGDEGDGGWQSMIIHLFIKYLGGLLIESQLKDVPHAALYAFVQRANEHRSLILRSPKATLCMAFHAAFIAKTLHRSDTYGFLLLMVAKALSLPMFPKSKRSDLSNTLKTFLQTQSYWMTDAEVRDVCGACIALRKKRIDVVATSVCLWLRRGGSLSPSVIQLYQMITMMATWRSTGGVRWWMDLYAPQVAVHVLAYGPTPVPVSIVLALEKLLLPLETLANEGDENAETDEKDQMEVGKEEGKDEGKEETATTTHETGPPIWDTAHDLVTADAHVIVDAQVHSLLVLGPVEFPIDDVITGPTIDAAGGTAAATSSAAAPATITTTDEVIAEAVDPWTVTATEAEADDDLHDADVVSDTPRNVAIVQLMHRVFRPQISMLIQQRCPHYTGELLFTPGEETSGKNPYLSSPRRAHEMGDAMIREVTTVVTMARKVETDVIVNEEDRGDNTNTTSSGESIALTNEDQCKLLLEYLGQGLAMEGLTPAQWTQLLSIITSVMMNPTQYAEECSDMATRCCIDLVDRNQFPRHGISLVIEATITATNRQPSGTHRQTLCWLLDQLIERYQMLMTMEDIDTLIAFFDSRLVTVPPGEVMTLTAAATATTTPTTTENTTDVSSSVTTGESFPSARQNSFVGLIKLVEVSQSNRCPLTRAQLKRIRDILVECLRWDSVTFETMNEIERDEVRVLLSGEIVATLNRLIAATVGSP